MESPKSLGHAVGQAGQLLNGLTTPQRLLLAAGAVATAVTLWFFVGWMAKPKLTTLYSGLSARESQQLAGRLAAANIAYELSPDGAVLSVPADQLDSARLKTAAEGLPRNARLGFEVFDTPNWAGSDFTEKVNYQRALEGELERTLESMSEVESVRVHLVMPEETLFSEEAREAKAAVIVKTRGGPLSEEARVAIPQLVASAVDRLRPENVTLVDADTNTPMLHGQGDGASSPDMEQELAKKIVATLEPVVGAEHVRASVHVEFDTSSSENTDEVYDPKSTATLTQQKSDEVAGGTAPAGVAGTASNTPGVAPPAATASSDNQSSHSESETYVVSKSIHHVVQPPGRVRRIAAAVLVDDAIQPADKAAGKAATRRKRTPEELKQLEQLAAAAIGLDTQRNDTLTVENLSFQQLPAEQPVPPAKIERARRIFVEWSGLLRYVGVTLLFVFVYFMMLRPIKKQILTAFRELPARLQQGKEGPKPLKPASEIEIEAPQGAEQGQLAAALKRQLVEKVKTEPGGASRLIQSWIREDA